jgi:hypothetical protein
MFLGLSACSILPSEPASQALIPTEQLPTVIAMTVEALVMQGATENPQEAQGTQQPSLTPTWEATPTSTPTSPPKSIGTETIPIPPPATATPLPPFEIPYAEIQFLSPGALSKIISPIKLHAFLLPGDTGRATVELFGEDGRLMYRQLFIFTSPPGLQTNLRTDIDFEIAGVAETATLVISTDDSYGRLKEIASIPLILLNLGDSDLNPAGDLLAPIVIQEPVSKILIQGDRLLVSGLVRTDSDQPLLVELVTTDGKVIGSRLAGIAPGEAGDHRLFAAEVTFSVDAPTWVRVTVSERNDDSSKPRQLTSVEVLLSP